MKDQIYKRFVVLNNSTTSLDDPQVSVYKVELNWLRHATTLADPFVRADIDIHGHVFSWYIFLRNGGISYPSTHTFEELSPPVSSVSHIRVSLFDSKGSELNTSFELGLCLYHGDIRGDQTGRDVDDAENALRHASVLLHSPSMGPIDFVTKVDIENVVSVKILECALARDVTPDTYVLLEFPALNKTVPVFFDTEYFDPRSPYQSCILPLSRNVAEIYPPVNFRGGLRLRVTSGDRTLLTAPVGAPEVAVLVEVRYMPRREESHYKPTAHICDHVIVDSRFRTSGTASRFVVDLPQTYRNVSRISLKHATLQGSSSSDPYDYVKIPEVYSCWALPHAPALGNVKSVHIAPSIQTKSLNPPISSLKRLTVETATDAICLLLEVSHNPRQEKFDPDCKSVYL